MMLGVAPLIKCSYFGLKSMYNTTLEKVRWFILFWRGKDSLVEHDSAWLSRKPFVLHVYNLPRKTFSAAGSSRLAQLVERETVNLEVVGSIPILRVQLTFFIY